MTKKLSRELFYDWIRLLARASHKNLLPTWIAVPKRDTQHTAQSQKRKIATRPLHFGDYFTGKIHAVRAGWQCWRREGCRPIKPVQPACAMESKDFYVLSQRSYVCTPFVLGQVLRTSQRHLYMTSAPFRVTVIVTVSLTFTVQAALTI
eukprot:3707971-Amphidinium_carterae.1